MIIMDILKYPLSTEKAIRMIESDNIITFIVDIRASRSSIKKEIEKRFNVKVKKISISITPKGKKKAYLKLNEDYPAIDIATRLGLM